MQQEQITGSQGALLMAEVATVASSLRISFGAEKGRAKAAGRHVSGRGRWLAILARVGTTRRSAQSIL